MQKYSNPLNSDEADYVRLIITQQRNEGYPYTAHLIQTLLDSCQEPEKKYRWRWVSALQTDARFGDNPPTIIEFDGSDPDERNQHPSPLGKWVLEVSTDGGPWINNKVREQTPPTSDDIPF